MVPPAFSLSNVLEMTQSSLGSRKRVRNDGDEESRDFTPLSKRINNLHINNGTNHSSSSHEEVLDDSPAMRNSCGAITCDEGRSNGGAMAALQQPHYRPDLNVSDNPFYYEPNKLLYYLYMERMQRSGQSY